jgi:hypothetical protein
MHIRIHLHEYNANAVLSMHHAGAPFPTYARMPAGWLNCYRLWDAVLACRVTVVSENSLAGAATTTYVAA